MLLPSNPLILILSVNDTAGSVCLLIVTKKIISVLCIKLEDCMPLLEVLDELQTEACIVSGASIVELLGVDSLKGIRLVTFTFTHATVSYATSELIGENASTSYSRLLSSS
ncbi:hypothetical protein AAHE18_04G111200 [Arachis hypogaea]